MSMKFFVTAFTIATIGAGVLAGHAEARNAQNCPPSDPTCSQKANELKAPGSDARHQRPERPTGHQTETSR